MTPLKLPQIAKDGAALISSNVWGQIIAFVAYLVLTRIYTPDDFGVYNIFYSYIEVLIILSTCKYELSIVIADTDREAAAISRLALRLNTIISLVLLSLLLLLHFIPATAQWALGGMQFEVALFIPFMVFFCGTTRVYTFLFNRFRKFGSIALSEVVTSTSGVVVKILSAFSSLLHHVGLPLGTVVGKMAGNINYLVRLKQLNLPKDIHPAEVKAAARKHRNFPLYTMPKELLNSFSYNLPFLWLALYFGKPEVGLYSLALTFTFRPINIFNTAFEKLLFVRTTEKVHRNQSIAADIRRFVIYVNLVALPLFAVAFLFAEPIFTFLFSGKWNGIGYYVRCLLPWVYVMLTSTSLSFLSNVFAKQRTEFVFYVVLLALRVAAILWGIYSHNFQQSVLLFAFSGALVSLALLAWYLHLVRRHEQTIAFKAQ